MSRTPAHRPAQFRPAPAIRRTADMNVTPLIDVLLVLLIVFITAVPLTQQGLDVDVPERAAPAARLPDPGSQIVAVYSADRVLTVNQQVVPLASAVETFRRLFDGRRDRTLFLIGDGGLRYGEIVKVIDAATEAGVTRVGIVTEGMRDEAARGQ